MYLIWFNELRMRYHQREEKKNDKLNIYTNVIISPLTHYVSIKYTIHMYYSKKVTWFIKNVM